MWVCVYVFFKYKSPAPLSSVFLTRYQYTDTSPMYTRRTQQQNTHKCRDAPSSVCSKYKRGSFVNSCHYPCTRSERGSSRRWSIFNLCCQWALPHVALFSTLVPLMFWSAIKRNVEKDISLHGFFNTVKNVILMRWFNKEACLPPAAERNCRISTF